MNQRRQPRGTSTGGQFAPDVNPECTVVLATEPATPDNPQDAIYEAQENVDLILRRYHSRDVIMSPDAIEAFDSMKLIVAKQQEIIDAQREEINALRKDRDENPSLDEIIVRRATGRLNDDDGPTDVDLTALAADYRRYSQGMHDRDYDGAFEGIDYVVEQFLDWRETEGARPTELKAKNVRHQPPFQVGSVLEYDVEVVPWVPGIHEENVAVQVWMKEWGDADTDCAGWEPRAIAQIARERGITNVTVSNLQDILDDPDISKIAFRSDTSISRLIEQINDCNSKPAKS